jgi:maleate isomerase
MKLPYSFDTLGHRASFGLLILQEDHTIDPDFRWLLPGDGLRLYSSRVRCPPEVTLDSLPTMQASLPIAAELLPQQAGISVIGYGCTSASAVMGEDVVARVIRAGRAVVEEGTADIHVTNPLSALKAACKVLKIKRLAVVSPYVPEVSERLVTRLKDVGIEVPAIGSFGEHEEHVVAGISTDSVRDAILEVARRTACDAVFASCTNLRACEVLAECEATLGMPVLASNQVLAWHMLRLAGLSDPLGCGGALSDCRVL